MCVNELHAYVLFERHNNRLICCIFIMKMYVVCTQIGDSNVYTQHTFRKKIKNTSLNYPHIISDYGRMEPVRCFLNCNSPWPLYEQRHAKMRLRNLCGQWRPRPVCAFAQFDQGLHCPPSRKHAYIILTPLNPTGVYIIFLISSQKHRLWVLVRTASSRRFWRVPTIYVLSRNMKNIRIFLSENFHFLLVIFSVYLNRHVFVMLQNYWTCRIYPCITKILIRLYCFAGWSVSLLFPYAPETYYFIGAARTMFVFVITKTYLYNFDPFKPHFYTVKLGFTGVYIIFLISAQKHRLRVLVRTASSRRF